MVMTQIFDISKFIHCIHVNCHDKVNYYLRIVMRPQVSNCDATSATLTRV